MAGVRYVMHVAADYRLWSADPEAIVRTNVEGTRTVMEAALRARRRARRLHQQRRHAGAACRRSSRRTRPSPLAETAAIGAYKRSKVAPSSTWSRR